MCIDYNDLKKVTIKNRYPLHMINDLFDQLDGTNIFVPKIDIRSGYHQLKVRSGYIEIMMFKTISMHFVFLVMLVDIINALMDF